MTFCYQLEPQANCVECLWSALANKEWIKTSFSELSWAQRSVKQTTSKSPLLPSRFHAKAVPILKKRFTW